MVVDNMDTTTAVALPIIVMARIAWRRTATALMVMEMRRGIPAGTQITTAIHHIPQIITAHTLRGAIRPMASAYTDHTAIDPRGATTIL